METKNSPSPQKPSKGYGKRPVWQWVVIYLVVAAVVYGLIYYVFSTKAVAQVLTATSNTAFAASIVTA